MFSKHFHHNIAIAMGELLRRCQLAGWDLKENEFLKKITQLNKETY